MRVAVCVATFQRPEELKRLLQGLNHLKFEKNAEPAIDIIIAENDDSGQGLAVCNAIRPCFRWGLIYGYECRRGISYARNKTISLVPQEADFIAFIDDDEIPDPAWLDELLAASDTYESAIITGPVVPMFDPDVPAWIVKGKFFERPRVPSGTTFETAASNNVLVKAALLRESKPAFDERFALTGSEDYHLFTRLHLMGHRIVRTNTAIVYEPIPPSRTTVAYILHVGFRVGNSLTLCELDLFPKNTWYLRFFKGIGRIMQGIVSLPIHVFWGRFLLVKDIRHIYYGFGMLTALFGYHYSAYRKIHTISIPANSTL